MSKITSKEHHDLIFMFEKEYPHYRHDKESKELWLQGNIYQDGKLNELFIAYRKGYSFGKTQVEQVIYD